MIKWGIWSGIVQEIGGISPDNGRISSHEKSNHELITHPLSTPVVVCPSPEFKTIPESIGSGDDHVHSSCASDDETRSKTLAANAKISHLYIVYVYK